MARCRATVVFNEAARAADVEAAAATLAAAAGTVLRLVGGVNVVLRGAVAKTQISGTAAPTTVPPPTASAGASDGDDKLGRTEVTLVPCLPQLRINSSVREAFVPAASSPAGGERRHRRRPS